MAKNNYWIVYTLKLEDRCWYVGTTTTLAFTKRMNDHWNQAGKGSQWTRLHKPVMVQAIDVYPRSLTTSEICKLEDARTLQLANNHGAERVRGGGYCQAMPKWTKPAKKKKNWDIGKARQQLSQSSARFK